LISNPLTAEPDFLENLLSFLSPDERERANRYRFEKHRNSFIVGRGLLRLILGGYIGILPSSVRFIYGDCGKPALLDRPDVVFNIAHSEDFMVCAVGENLQLGVDIEFIREIENMEDIARHFFCFTEYREVFALPAELRARAFFNCWTRKEAFIKALGHGLSYPLDRFRVTLEPGQRAELLSIEGCEASQLRWSLHDVTPSNNYAATLAVDDRNCGVNIWKFDSPTECAIFCTQNR